MFKFLISLLVLIPYIFLKSKKSLHMLQQNWYNDGNRYLKWINNNKNKVFINYDILFIIFLIGLLLDSNITMIIFVIFYVIISLLYLNSLNKEKIVKPLVFTKRVKRLLITDYLIYIVTALIISLIDRKSVV